MTQGRDGISLAPKGARTFMGIARRLSVVTAMLAVAALLATTGTSFAQSKKVKRGPHNGLLDTLTVSNYGSAFGGSDETFLLGAGATAAPNLWVKGPNTKLGSGTGPEGVNVSSFDDHIANAIPIDLLDIEGFGAVAGLSTHAGTGFVEIFSPGANGNSAPEAVIGSPTCRSARPTPRPSTFRRA